MTKRAKRWCLFLLAIPVVYIGGYIADSISGGYYFKAENDAKSRFQMGELSFAAFTATLWQPRFGYAGWNEIDAIGWVFYPAIVLDRRFFHHTAYATDPGVFDWVRNLPLSKVHPHSRAEFEDARRLRKANAGYVIIPGKQLGPLTLGMNDDQVNALLGEGEHEEFPGTAVEWWPADAHDTLETAHFFSTYTPVHAGDAQGRRVTMIRVTSDIFNTASGICVDSGRNPMWKAFPNLKWAREFTSEAGTLDTYDDEESGIGFQIWRVRGKHPRFCSSILVHQPGVPLGELPDLKQQDTDEFSGVSATEAALPMIFYKTCLHISLLTMGCAGFGHSLLARSPTSGHVHTREYSLGSDGSNKLSVVIARQPDPENADFEDIVCKFVNVSGTGDHKIVGVETSDISGIPGEDIVHVGDFLRNGRKQVLVATVGGNTFGKVYDFDGERVILVYDTDAYDGRKYLYVRHGRDGQLIIQEEFSAPSGLRRNEDQFPPGVIYVKDRGICVRLVRWEDYAWAPVKFRYIDKTDEAIPR